MNLTALLLSIAALIYWYHYRPWDLLRTPLALWCMAFLAWILLRDVSAGSSWSDAWGQVNDFRPLIFVVLWAPLFAPMMHRKVAAVTFGVCMAVFCLFMLAAALWSNTENYIDTYHRAPDLSGPLLVTAIMAAVQLAVTKSQRQSRWLWWTGAALGTTTLFLATGRRTGDVAFVLCAVVLALMHLPGLKTSERRSLIVKIAWIAVLTGVLALAAVATRVGIIKVGEEIAHFSNFSQTNSLQHERRNVSNGERLRLWSVTSELVKERPWIGSGLSQFPQRYSFYDSRMGGSGLLVKNPHNEYLYILAGLGVIGLGMYLAIQWQVIRQARRFSNVAQRNILWLAMIALLSSILFNSMIIDMVPGHFYALTLLCLGWFGWTDEATQEVST